MENKELNRKICLYNLTIESICNHIKDANVVDEKIDKILFENVNEINEVHEKIQPLYELKETIEQFMVLNESIAYNLLSELEKDFNYLTMCKNCNTLHLKNEKCNLCSKKGEM